MQVVPSILDLNIFDLDYGIQVSLNEGIKTFHVDVMDAHFVPNLSFSPSFVNQLKEKFPTINIEIHLMSDNLEDLIPAFIKAGADLLEFHYEASKSPQIVYWLDYMHRHNVKTGLVLNPDTPIAVIKGFVNQIDQLLIMSVYPGFGGQKYINKTNKRIKDALSILTTSQKHIPIEVDGGINENTIVEAKNAGCENFVAGSYIYGNSDIRQQIINLRHKIIK